MSHRVNFSIFLAFLAFFAPVLCVNFVFDSEGVFKVLVFTDLHLGGIPCTKKNDVTSLDIVHYFIDNFPMDLAVITGDVVNGYSFFNANTTYEYFKKGLEPFETAKIPWALTLGNHDWQSPGDMRKILQNVLDTSSYSATTLSDKPMRALTNFVLEIKDSANSTYPEFLLYFLDTGNLPCPESTGSGCIDPTQSDWLLQTSKNYAIKRGSSTPTPAIEFHHIPSEEIREWWADSTASCQIGEKFENVTCMEGIRISGLLKQAGVIASYCGHDHTNLIECTKDGLTMGYNPKSGQCLYGEPIGARLITLKLNRAKKTVDFSTKVIHVSGKEFIMFNAPYPRKNIDLHCSNKNY